jgi:hypothetical protein
LGIFVWTTREGKEEQEKAYGIELCNVTDFRSIEAAIDMSQVFRDVGRYQFAYDRV